MNQIPSKTQRVNIGLTKQECQGGANSVGANLGGENLGADQSCHRRRESNSRTNAAMPTDLSQRLSLALRGHK